METKQQQEDHQGSLVTTEITLHLLHYVFTDKTMEGKKFLQQLAKQSKIFDDKNNRNENENYDVSQF